MAGYVMITGATSGIGLAIAKVFWEKGHDLILVGRDEAKLRQLETVLRAQKSDLRLVIYRQDLSKQGAGSVLYSWVKESGFVVDILINNAGVGYVGEFCECSECKLVDS